MDLESKQDVPKQIIHCPHDELVKISKLKKHPKNRNSHPEAQIERLSKILAYQGFRYPVKVSKRSGYVVSGHGRILAAKALGWKEVPVSFQDYDSDEQEYSDAVSDNSIAAWSELDLSGINNDMADLGPDFDIDLLGIRGFVLEPAEKLEPQCDEDEVPEVKHPISKKGDIWILGNHRLMCGDSTVITDVEKLKNGKEPEIMYTDPPYGVKLDQSWRDKALGSKALGKGNANTIISDDRFDWTETYSLFNGDVAYVWCPSKFYHEFHKNLESCNLVPTQMIVWNKSVMVMGRSDYHWKHEPCIYAIRKNKQHRWAGDRKQTTVWDAAPPNHIMGGSKEDKTDHPSQKPVSLAEIAISNHDCNLVYEPFCGSGSTLIACEKLNKKCFAMELDPKYCDIILSRWQKYTGNVATLESTGQTYEELKAVRNG